MIRLDGLARSSRDSGGCAMHVGGMHVVDHELEQKLRQVR